MPAIYSTDAELDMYGDYSQYASTPLAYPPRVASLDSFQDKATNENGGKRPMACFFCR
jgi:hypothetical protein